MSTVTQDGRQARHPRRVASPRVSVVPRTTTGIAGYYEDQLPYFLHISKNGGHTVRYVLSENYEPERFLNLIVRGRRSGSGRGAVASSPDAAMVHAIADIRSRQATLRCLAATIPFGIHRFLERPLAYFTFLREPVSRCVSYWFFSYDSRTTHPAWSTFQRFDFDLKRLLEERAIYQFMNDQTRIVTGTSKADLGVEDLAKAKELIEREYTFVGALESFDPCIAVLARRFGWNRVSYVVKNKRITNDATLLPPGAARLFRDANEFDIKLHEWLLTVYLPRWL